MILYTSGKLSLRVVSFKDPQKYSITSSTKKDLQTTYLRNGFQFHPSYHLETTKEYYDYPQDSVLRFHVDFANRFLGGGVLKHGFVQEEIAFCECPAAAALVQQQGPIRTRHDEASVLEGRPNPLLLLNLERVQAIKKSVYGEVLGTYSETPDIRDAAAHLVPPQTVHFIAIAAPCLRRGVTPAQQCAINTLLDLTNTLFAGFELAQKHAAGSPFIIHSGAIGCGAFYNDRKAVFLLHLLVAQHLGIHLVLHGYEEEKIEPYKKLWSHFSPTIQGLPLYVCIERLSTQLLERAGC